MAGMAATPAANSGSWAHHVPWGCKLMKDRSSKENPGAVTHMCHAVPIPTFEDMAAQASSR